MSGSEQYSDTPDAPFYRSGATSPQQTWAEAAKRLSAVVTSAARAAKRGDTAMTTERICAWHRAIFLTTFERDAGRVRADDEPIVFSVPIEIDGGIHETLMQGILGRSRIMAELDFACERFNANLSALEHRAEAIPADEGAAAPAELYVEILKAHPFIDGNLRAAYVALIAGLAAVGLPAVDFRAVLNRHDECLGWAMREDARRTIDPLAELIVELAS